jgi:hypothetical protein
MSRRPGCGGHGGITVGQDVLDELIFLLQCHVVDIMVEVTLFTEVTSLAAVVACLHDGFEGPSAVDVHQDARGSARKGVCIAAGVTVVGGPCERRKDNGVRGGAE